MKKTLFCIVAGLLAFHTAHAQVSLPFQEHFAYTNNSTLGSSSGGSATWTLGSAGSGLVVSNVAALTYSGLAGSSSNGVSLSGTSSRNRGVQFSAVTNADGNTVYCSFLLNIRSLPSGNRYTACLHGSTSITTTPALALFVNSAGSVGISRAQSSPAALSPTLSAGTHLIVARYTFHTGSNNDQADLWVDPASLGDDNNIPEHVASVTAGGSEANSLQSFFLNTPSSGGGTVWIDEVKLGTSWSQVTPSDGSGPTNPPAVTNIPVVTNISATVAGVVLRGGHGVTNGAYQLMATTDIARPIGQWDAIGTYTFDANGNFACTNAINPDVPDLYYRVAVNGALPTPPAITDQPDSLSVVIGQDAAFSVTAKGGDLLSYQWYFNTNTLLAGKTSSTLTIPDANTNNEGAYSVVVSNNLGSVTSVIALLAVNEAPTNGAYYVATNGDDSNPGSIGAPFATLPKAISVALPGDTIYLRDGSYYYSETIRIEKSGIAGNPINIWAFPGEHPLLDFVNQPYGSNNRGVLFTTNSSYWTMKGIEIARAGDNGVKVEGSHLRFEQCVFHHNGDSGMQIGFGHPAVNNINLAAFIEVINCDSYRNYDKDNRGSDADGFAAKLHCGQGIIFMGCRSWENSDDGWDLFETDSGIIISNCWTWHSGDGALFPGNGSFQGNGNGFKLGGNGAGGSSKGTHAIYNSVSFNHKFKSSTQGFTQNSHKDGEIVVDCLSFSNSPSGYNYFFEGGVNAGKANVFTNNVGLPKAGGGGNFTFDPPIVEQNNTWNLSVTANAADYGDLTEAAAAAPRQPDGSLPTGFARLVSGSDLIDKGVPVGTPFTGSAPDLGPYEFSP